jgi:hypothetical protein
MPRRQGKLLGHVSGPECRNELAEVREGPCSGEPYRICAQCVPASVYLTRGAPLKVERLLACMRPVKSAGAAPRARARDRAGPGGLSRALLQLHSK